MAQISEEAIAEVAQVTEMDRQSRREETERFERRQAAARVVTEHRPVRRDPRLERGAHHCRCEELWTPLHVAEVLDRAGLLKP